MKNLIIFLVVSLILVNVCLAAEIQYRLDILNITTKPETFEFDIILKNESAEYFLYSAGQYFIELNATTSFVNNEKCEIIASDLPIELQPRNAKCFGNMLMLASNKINKEVTFKVKDKAVLIARIRTNLPLYIGRQNKFTMDE